MKDDPYLKKNREALKKSKSDKDREAVLNKICDDGYNDGLAEGKADKEAGE